MPGPTTSYITDPVDEKKLAISEAIMPASDAFYKYVVIPGVIAAAGLTFLGQAVAFAKQLAKGESEFED